MKGLFDYFVVGQPRCCGHQRLPRSHADKRSRRLCWVRLATLNQSEAGVIDCFRGRARVGGLLCRAGQCRLLAPPRCCARGGRPRPPRFDITSVIGLCHGAQSKCHRFSLPPLAHHHHVDLTAAAARAHQPIATRGQWSRRPYVEYPGRRRRYLTSNTTAEGASRRGAAGAG
jgi:hypothetical protein